MSHSLLGDQNSNTKQRFPAPKSLPSDKERGTDNVIIEKETMSYIKGYIVQSTYSI